MTSIDLSGLNIDQLTDLVGKAQSEMASREKKKRKDLRSELERRVAADGYKMGDIFTELGSPMEAVRVARSARPSTAIRRTPTTLGAASDALRGGSRRLSRSAGSTFRRSSDPDVPDPRVAPIWSAFHSSGARRLSGRALRSDDSPLLDRDFE